ERVVRLLVPQRRDSMQTLPAAKRRDVASTFRPKGHGRRQFYVASAFRRKVWWKFHRSVELVFDADEVWEGRRQPAVLGERLAGFIDAARVGVHVGAQRQA